MARREWIDQDFYGRLGVPADASGKEIDDAYRTLTDGLQPDENPDDAAAAERFDAASEAYAVLSDDATRREYDEVRRLFDGAGPDAEPEQESDQPGDDETSAATGAADDAEAGEPVPAAGGERRPGRSIRWWIGAAVLAGTLAGAGVEGWLLFAQHQRGAAAAAALDAAEKYTLTLTSVEQGSIDQNFADVLDGATGEFKEQYAKSSEQLRQLLIANKAAAHGTVIDAAVKSATRTRVEVLLFVDQAVSNKSVTDPQIDRSRIVMTMEKVDGRWLAAKVDMP